MKDPKESLVMLWDTDRLSLEIWKFRFRFWESSRQD